MALNLNFAESGVKAPPREYNNSQGHLRTLKKSAKIEVWKEARTWKES